MVPRRPRRDAAGARIPARLIGLVFLPFVTGYFLSYFFRNVNAVIAKDLAREFALGAAGPRAAHQRVLRHLRALPAPARRAARPLTARGAWSRRSCASPRPAQCVFGNRGRLRHARPRPRADRARRLGVPDGFDQGVHALVSALAAGDGQRLVHLPRRRSAGSRRPRRSRPRSASWAGARCSTAWRPHRSPAALLIAVCVPEKPLPGAGATWGEQFRVVGRISRDAALLAHRAPVRRHARRLPGDPGPVAGALARRRRRASGARPRRGCCS